MERIIGFIKQYISPITILGLCVMGITGSPLPFIGYRLGTTFILLGIMFFYIFFEMPVLWGSIKSLFKKQ